ncbi:MAG: hypothetical protein HFI86_03870 [Bacilli bacterium]|nr:hypothetical protein [Bacilli bacterium]MCI9434402.1 hypothetical protein [Bacilli bacterium]
MKKTTNSNIFHKIGSFLDRKIIIPITKLILKITEKFDKSSRKFENWLSKTSTLLFISLIIAIIVFVVVDQKMLLFSESSAELLKSQPVQVIMNEEAYVVEGLPETVDITLIGRKADLYFAKQSPSHDVVVDLTGLKPGTHRVNIKYNQALASIDYNVNPSTATVIIYPKISETRTLTYDLLNQDSLDSRLVIDDVSISTDKVVIKGAEYQLKKVATVKALIDINNLVKKEVGVITVNDIPLKAYDENGNVVDVEIVPEKINADITITSPSKELPIKVIPVGTVSFGKAISSIDTSETNVIVYGDEETLKSLTYIPVEIDVNDLKGNKQYKLELEKPVGIRHMDVNNITVNVGLDNSTSKELTGVDIKYRNLADGYTVQGISANDTTVSVTLKGVESVIKNINNDDVTAYLDLTGYGEGVHEVEVLVTGDDVKVEYVAKTMKVNIRITKK